MLKNDNIRKNLLLITFAGLILCLVININIIGNIIKTTFNIISPFIIGAALAFLINIPMKFYQKKVIGNKIKNKETSKTLALIMAILTVIVILFLVIYLIVPELVNVVKMLIDNIPFYTEKLKELLMKLNISLDSSIMDNLNIANIKNEIGNLLANLVSSSIFIVKNIIGTISNLVIAIIFCIYLVSNKDKIKNQFTKLMYGYLPVKVVDKFINVCETSRYIFSKFFTVQCLEALILGSLAMIGMFILKIPYAIPIGVLIGVTALIPVVGAFIGVAIGAILIVSVNPIKTITFIIFILLLQQIEGNLIYPKVVGSSVGLPGIWVLVAVSVGGAIGGITGMILAVPITTVIYTLLRTDVNKRLNTKKIKIN